MEGWKGGGKEGRGEAGTKKAPSRWTGSTDVWEAGGDTPRRRREDLEQAAGGGEGGEWNWASVELRGTEVGMGQGSRSVAAGEQGSIYQGRLRGGRTLKVSRASRPRPCISHIATCCPRGDDPLLVSAAEAHLRPHGTRAWPLELKYIRLCRGKSVDQPAAGANTTPRPPRSRKSLYLHTLKDLQHRSALIAELAGANGGCFQRHASPLPSGPAQATGTEAGRGA